MSINNYPALITSKFTDGEFDGYCGKEKNLVVKYNKKFSANLCSECFSNTGM